MPAVIVIGGGLTGLSAAWELERLGIDYLLIEVKPRLGGSIVTTYLGDFVLDGGPFIHQKRGEWPFLAELGIPDALERVGRYREARLVIFRRGTQTLVDALARQITHPVMLRMAVSSLGRVDERTYGVCLENGLMLECRGIIIAAPARYAEHMLRTLLPEAAEALLDYAYEPIARVAIGCRLSDAPELIERPEGALFRFVEGYTFPAHVPEGHILIRAGVRLNVDPAVHSPQAALETVREFAAPAVPLVEMVTYWPEDFPLGRGLPEHQVMMDTIESQLPPDIALVGSDYRGKHLQQQVEQGRAAAQQVAAAIGH